jgi:tRNA A-37 threonylcarbamoyl transferase component Bud32
MQQKLKLPAGLGFQVLPYNMDPDKIIKAETRCLIWTEQSANGTSVVMKMYYRRGLANFIRGKILNFRVNREFRILKHVAGCGVPCTLPLDWTVGYCKTYGFYEILHTRQIPNTMSLKSFLTSEAPTDKNFDLGPLFQLVCRMHRCGVYHGALSTKNILIDPTGNPPLKFYSLDFACGWLFPGSIIGRQMAWFDLLKLVRSVENHLSPGYCQPYLAQYGLEKGAVERLYQDAGRFRSYSRKNKRIKNVLKIKVFFYAILTQLNPNGNIF